jgi:hypothetical protein
VPPSDTFERDEQPTLVPCLACGGNWRTFETSSQPAPKGTSKTFKVLHCAWCIQGAMTQAQVDAYRARPKRGSGEIVVPRLATVHPPLAMCCVCGKPITQPADMVIDQRKDYHCAACEQA